MGELWMKKGMFKRHSGFSKHASLETNLKVMYKNTHLKNPANAWRRVGRQAQVLANLTQDRVTYTKASAVAQIAFKRLSEIHKKEMK